MDICLSRMPFGLCNAPGTFQRCMMAIFHDMIKKTMEVFMDDFSVFGDSFSTCLSHLDKTVKRCEEQFSPKWEKKPFHGKRKHCSWDKNLQSRGIEVDLAKVDVIALLPSPDYCESTDAVDLLLQEFDVVIQEIKKEQRIWPPIIFPDLRTLIKINSILQNTCAGNIIVRECHPNRKASFSKMSNTTSGMTPSCSKSVRINMIRRYNGSVARQRALDFSKLADGPTGRHHGANLTAKKVFDADSLGLQYTKCPRFAKSVKYGVHHRLSTAYYPRQFASVGRFFEVSIRGLKRILERSVGRKLVASWSEQLDDALLWLPVTALQHILSVNSVQACIWKSKMFRIFEASRARGICPSIIRASQSSASFGNPDILILSTNVYL
ncbi:reverse transcriptase domain-containing protein [Tanacetum coccineum]